MRDEIRKVIEMTKAGQITEDQAAELIAEIKSSTKTSAPGEFNLNSLGEMLTGLVNSALSVSVGGGHVKIRASSNEANEINASKVEMPTGEDFEFSDNEINLSSISGIQLSHSANISDNKIQASTLKNICIEHGEWTDSQLNGSSFEDLEIDASEWTDQNINGSKFSKVKLLANSDLHDMQWHGCAFKNVTFKAAELSDMQWHGCTSDQVTIDSCEWSDLTVSGCKLSECTLENVKLSDGKIEGCRLVGCTIKNVDLSDFAWSKLDFTGQTIGSNQELEKFLQRANG